MKYSSVTPYLSIVIPFRNDNYSPNAIEKLNFSLNILIDQLNENNLDSEIIIVDWNSPNPKKKLIKKIDVKKKSKNVTLYIYEVKKAIHLRYKGHENRNLVTEVAFNVGIRRSRGKFVVLKTGDTFYSKELVDFLSKKTLREDKVYRLDRVDVEIDFPPPKNWQNYFENNILVRKTSPKNSIHTKACGDFTLMSRDKWIVIKGVPESKQVFEVGTDGEVIYAAIGSGAKQVYLKKKLCIYKIIHPNIYDLISKHNHTSLKNNLPQKLFVVSKKNKLQNFVKITYRIIMGVLNLPSTRINNVKTRSAYRYYLVANFRRLLFGGNFLKSNNWGLPNLNLKKKIILPAKWEK